MSEIYFWQENTTPLIAAYGRACARAGARGCMNDGTDGRVAAVDEAVMIEEASRSALAAAIEARDDYLTSLTEALHSISKWSEAYPTCVFPEPDEAYYAKAHEVLTANGMTLDRLSAAAMRHVIKGVGEIARNALALNTTGWQPIETAEKNRTPRILKLKDRIPNDRDDLRRWDGVVFVGNHPGVADDGFDMGWQFAAPVGHVGFPDEWFEGWRPLSPAPSTSLEPA